MFDILFTCLVVDILSIIALGYIIIVLWVAEHKSKKSGLTIKFERVKRERIFRNSLILLVLSFIFSFVAVYGSTFNACGDRTVEIARLLSKIMLFLFIIYIIRILKYATISEK